ncbi:Cu and Ag efflux protein CusF [Andreprevotia lacus DSM 23236]|jgi:Cu(I)/Ag(I) efflux system membrane fusion protein|uniref:Cu and Ag efflux protein CusF n=1 Tax=Andreprevotia lacus DSM 23236 TaxID=1121001 RepID=A0A1W1XZI9_9NEIS|nr:copper-binding protein [Andreprevotia lacus]SMC29389.1 Cu and Ag efflux protein CusF [Andreprevotia lacus DSM 23236]
MKQIARFMLTASIAALAFHAQADDMKKINAKPAASKVATHHGVGVVKQVSGNNVLIAHEEIKSLGWMAMTMPFEAKDKALLTGLKAGTKIEFDFVQDSDMSLLTSVTRK